MGPHKITNHTILIIVITTALSGENSQIATF